MASYDVDMTLERYAQDYANDPEFIAEGLSIKVIEEVLQYLEQNNRSQSWLAQETRVSRAHISRMLNAPSNMTLLTIAKIAVALGVTPDICLNAESRRLPVTVPAAHDAMVEVITKRLSDSKYQYRQSAAEAVGGWFFKDPLPEERVPQEVTA